MYYFDVLNTKRILKKISSFVKWMIIKNRKLEFRHYKNSKMKNNRTPQ